MWMGLDLVPMDHESISEKREVLIILQFQINDSVTFNIKTTTSDTEKTTATINSTIILNSEKGQLCLGFFCLHQGQTMKHRHF
jgi:hypothetical protein